VAATQLPPTATAHEDADRARSDRRLFDRYVDARDPTDREAVVERFLPLARQLAARYQRPEEPFDDVFQVACYGLVKAVDRFDVGRGVAFSSYAVPTITGEIKRHFRDHMWTLHVPRRVQDLRNRVRQASKELSQNTPGRAPTIQEIAEHAHLSEGEVRTGVEALECFSALSLEAEMPGTDGYALGDALGDADPAFDVVVDRVAVKPCLERLPERERTILYLRFFGGMTQSRIAQQLGISQMHVSRLLSGCFAHLREELVADAR
jgi:RNA polymerase sigma-B factor